MARPRRLPDLPGLVLGLLWIGIAAGLTARIVSGAIHAPSHIHDTISVTGSARKPISSDLARWSVSVAGEAAKPTVAARQLRAETRTLRVYLKGEGIPNEAITSSVVTSEQNVIQLPHHRRRVTYRVTQRLDISSRRINVVERASTGVGGLIERGVRVSTELTKAKLDALAAATEDARRRAEVLGQGLGGKLGPMGGPRPASTRSRRGARP